MSYNKATSTKEKIEKEKTDSKEKEKNDCQYKSMKLKTNRKEQISK